MKRAKNAPDICPPLSGGQHHLTMNGYMENRAEYIKRQDKNPYADINAADQQALYSIFRSVCGGNMDKAPVTRMADYLDAVSRDFPTRINENELIVGTDIYTIPFADTEYRMYYNNGHYNADYERLLSIGIEGVMVLLINSANKNKKKKTDENISAFLSVLESFSRLIRRYAKKAEELAQKEKEPDIKGNLVTIAADCHHISQNAPVSFRQALQLVYFTQVFLHLEGMGSNNMSFGRMDQILYPFYSQDIKNNTMNKENAEELIMCFCDKVSHCDVSQNLTLGGVDRDGNPFENELTVLFISAQRKTGLRQPSLSLLVQERMSDTLWDEALRCVASGIGMPAFFGNRTVVSSLLRMGVPVKEARDYAIIGCYEANPQGTAFGKTTELPFDLPALINEFLSANAYSAYHSFNHFFDMFLKHAQRRFTKRAIPLYQTRRDHYNACVASPFWACLAGGCIEKGLTPEQYGTRYNWLGLNMFGIGTLIDSLFVIKRLVFDEKKVSLKYFHEQVSQNFPDERFYAICRNMDGKFGTNHSESNSIARHLSLKLGKMALRARLSRGVRLQPSLFCWMSDIYTKHYPATPDGRKNGERLSYGASPSELARGVSPTSMLSSVCQLRLDMFSNGCPVALNLPPDILEAPYTANKIRCLIELYCKMGGFHLHINTQSAETLKKAKENPSDYPNLLIRISGHSNYFVALDERLQDALIQRAEAGK